MTAKEELMEPIKNILPKIKPAPANGGTSGDRSAESANGCSICHGVGVVHPVDAEGNTQYGQVVPCECSRERVLRERYEHMLKLCQLPAATTNWTFENFDASGPLQ